MDVDKIHKYCGTKADAELIPLLGVHKSTISKWRSGGIPAERQAVFEVLSKGQLKAELKEFKLETLLPEFSTTPVKQTSVIKVTAKKH